MNRKPASCRLFLWPGKGNGLFQRTGKLGEVCGSGGLCFDAAQSQATRRFDPKLSISGFPLSRRVFCTGDSMYALSKFNSWGQWAFCVCLAVAPALSAQETTHSFSDSDSILYEHRPELISPQEPRVLSPTTPIIKTKHQYGLSADGSFEGRVTSSRGLANGMSIFLVANNKLVGNSTTDRFGDFVLENIPPGIYSLYAVGNGEIAAQGISIVPDQSVATEPLEMTTATTEYEGLRQLIEKTMLPEIVDATKRTTSQVSVVTTDSETIHRVRVINGGLRGQVSSLVRESNAAGVQIHLIENGQSISQVETNALGSFLIPDIEPGNYQFVAVGQQGFAALQIEAIGATSPIHKIAYQQHAASLLEVSLAENGTAVQETLSDEIDYVPTNEALMEPSLTADNAPIQYATESIGCGSAGGGTAGSFGNYTSFANSGGVGGRFGGRFGGFSGGLGGSRIASGSLFGRLVTLGALGGSITAIANDNNPNAASPTN